MGKIRVKTLGNEEFEQQQQEEAKKRREGKKAQKAHVKGVGLKGGQQIKVMEGVELKPEVEKLLHEEGKSASAEGSGEKKKVSKKKAARVRSQRYQELTKLVDHKKLYPLEAALDLVKQTAKTRFDGTVETHINLNPALFSKEKTSLSGTVILPHGAGKKRRIAIASEELIKDVEAGKIKFDVLVSHPSLMPRLAKVARILGPKGLMPNPKNQTVTQDPEKRAKELEGGELAWKTEPNNPIIHQAIGKVSFAEAQLEENLSVLVTAIDKNKIAKLTLNATMGPGIKVDLNSF